MNSRDFQQCNMSLRFYTASYVYDSRVIHSAYPYFKRSSRLAQGKGWTRAKPGFAELELVWASSDGDVIDRLRNCAIHIPYILVPEKFHLHTVIIQYNVKLSYLGVLCKHRGNEL